MSESDQNHVSREYIDGQRAAGWPDMHPEDFCHRCGNRNLSWWIDSDIWNAVMHADGVSEHWNGIVCPSCFAELFEAMFPRASWRLSVDPRSVGGRDMLAEFARRR